MGLGTTKHTYCEFFGSLYLLHKLAELQAITFGLGRRLDFAEGDLVHLFGVLDDGSVGRFTKEPLWKDYESLPLLSRGELELILFGARGFSPGRASRWALEWTGG